MDRTEHESLQGERIRPVGGVPEGNGGDDRRLRAVDAVDRRRD